MENKLNYNDDVESEPIFVAGRTTPQDDGVGAPNIAPPVTDDKAESGEEESKTDAYEENEQEQPNQRLNRKIAGLQTLFNKEAGTDAGHS